MNNQNVSAVFNKLMEVKQMERFFTAFPAKYDGCVMMVVDRKELADWLKIDERALIIAIK